MDPRLRSSGRSARLLLAAVATLAWVAASIGVVAVAGDAGGTKLRPDLVTEPFEELRLEHAEEHDLLRLSNTIANRGRGPLEILPQSGDEDCDSLPGEDRFAYQRTFTDVDGNGRFHRATDDDARRRVAGCMRFHPQHAHWHFEGFSRYLLNSEATHETVARATKVGFCVLDLRNPYPGLPGSPRARFYDSRCDPDSVEGLSVGWADIYAAYLAGQTLDVTGLPEGQYCLVSIADPLDQLRESDESNNQRTQRIFLPAEGQVERLPGGCASA